jgi:hypothetical protein
MAATTTNMPSQTDLLNAIDTITETIQEEEGYNFNNSNTNHHVEPIDMFNVIQSLNDVSAENDHQEICTVCQDILDNGEQVHFLPECKHGYHTNCILTWFRCGNNNCPCCGDRGINHKEVKSYRRSRATGWGWVGSSKRRNPHYLKLRAFASRKDAPTPLKNIVDKLKASEQELLDFIRIFKEGSNDRDEIAFKEVHKIVIDFHKKRRQKQEKINKYVSDIIDYPIIPLIIPVRKNITN